MRKKCFITYRFKTGGVEKLFITLSQALEEEIYLLILNPDFDEILHRIPANVRIIRLPRFAARIGSGAIRYFVSLAWLFFMLRFRKEYRNAVYINFSDTLSTLLATRIFAGKKRRYSWVQMNPGVLSRSRFRKLYAILYAAMNRVICICEQQRTLFAALFPAVDDSRLEVIGNCIDPGEIDREKLEPVSYDKEYMLMVARLDSRSKDFYTLIDAYHRLPPELKQRCDLLILGEGPERPALERYIAAHGLQNSVRLLGQQQNPYKWMSRAVFYVHSSTAEGFGLALVEAMQCGAPVIATDCEVGPAEILQNGLSGMLVPVGDADAMYKAMLAMSDAGRAEHFRKEGCNRAAFYHVSNTVTKLKKIIV